MRIPGKRVKRTRLIQTDKYVVAVEVELVIPEEDPREACYEHETLQLIRQIEERAEIGDVNWLRLHGVVYEIMEATNQRLERPIAVSEAQPQTV